MLLCDSYMHSKDSMLCGTSCGGAHGAALWRLTRKFPTFQVLHSIHQQVSQARICKSCCGFARSCVFLPSISLKHTHAHIYLAYIFSDRPDHIYSLSPFSLLDPFIWYISMISAFKSRSYSQVPLNTTDR